MLKGFAERLQTFRFTELDNECLSVLRPKQYKIMKVLKLEELLKCNTYFPEDWWWHWSLITAKSLMSF